MVGISTNSIVVLFKWNLRRMQHLVDAVSSSTQAVFLPIVLIGWQMALVMLGSLPIAFGIVKLFLKAMTKEAIKESNSYDAASQIVRGTGIEPFVAIYSTL